MIFRISHDVLATEPRSASFLRFESAAQAAQQLYLDQEDERKQLLQELMLTRRERLREENTEEGEGEDPDAVDAVASVGKPAAWREMIVNFHPAEVPRLGHGFLTNFL